MDSSGGLVIIACACPNLPYCSAPGRKRNDDEDALEEFYTLVTHVPVLPGGYKGLETQPAEED